MPSNDIAGLPARTCLRKPSVEDRPDVYGITFYHNFWVPHTSGRSCPNGAHRSRVRLTLSGGRVFRNPITLIWASIQWATG